MTAREPTRLGEVLRAAIAFKEGGYGINEDFGPGFVLVGRYFAQNRHKSLRKGPFGKQSAQ